MSNCISPATINTIHLRRDSGASKMSVANELKIDYNTVRKWWNKDAPVIQSAEISDLKLLQCRFESDRGYQQQYTYVLGLYLGDGYINLQSPTYGVYKLRITQTSRYPEIIEEHRRALETLFADNVVSTLQRPGANCTEIHVHSKHIPILFPQLGVGLKSRRSIALEEWQTRSVAACPWWFLRGLIQTDGCRYVHRVGKFSYVKYNFTNTSNDIVELFTSACDSVGVKYAIHSRPSMCPQTGKKTGSTKTTVTINRREDVELFEQHIGPKC